MSSLRNPVARAILIQRLQKLAPTAQSQWGSFNAPRMICHLADTLAMALGDLPTQSVNMKAFQCFPLKHLLLYVLPMSKGLPTAPELLSSQPIAFEADRQRVIELMERLAAAPDGPGAEHPFFGPLTVEEWKHLQAKHIDHHLRQFGC
jgi:hypothetical protein